jgi:hypothetical protein
MTPRFVTRYGLRLTRHSSFITRSLPIWSLLLVVLLAAAPLWGPGIVNTRGGGDSPFLLQRTQQMAVNLRSGVFPARWMPDAAYGLGYPFFNHYSALPFYLAALLNILGLDLLTVLKLTQTLGFLIAALAMFGWVNRLWRHRAAAWLAAIAYTVAPFHLVNVYVRGDSLSEFYAFVFYPLILWALVRVVAQALGSQNVRFIGKTEFRNVVVLALVYAGLILSHNISAFIYSPFALLFLIVLILAAKDTGHTQEPAHLPGILSRRFWMLKPLGLGLLGLLLGMALSAWAWLPALLERNYVQSETLTLGFFDFANHFRTSNLVQPTLLFDYSISVTLGGRSPFSMGGPQALIVAAGLLMLLRYALKRRPGSTTHDALPDHVSRVTNQFSTFVYLSVGLLLSTGMITPLSRPLWDHVPLLATVQFPWRFLSVQSLFAAAAAAVGVLCLNGWRAWATGGAIAALLVVSTLLPLRPERLPIGPEDVTTMRLQEYELFTSNIGTTIRWEWLPRAAVPRPFTSDTLIEPANSPQAIALTGTLVEATQTQRHPTERLWRVQTGNEGATLAFPLLYWPGWSAWVDGERTAARAAEGSGYLALEVPPGEHTVRLKLGRTPLRAGAETLSLITVLGLLVVAVWRAPTVPRIASGAWRMAHRSVRYTPYVVPVLAGLLFLAARSSPPTNRSDDLTMDFVAMPFLHHNPDGVAFAVSGDSKSEDQIRLSSYTYSADQLFPGETLTITAKWERGQRSADERRVTLRLVSPAEHLPDLHSGPYALAEDTAALSETTVFRLNLPENTPRGVYLPQVVLWGQAGEWFALTPSGEGRGRLYLQPMRVTEGARVPADAPLLALVGPDIRLHAAELEQTPLASSPHHLTVRLEWSAVRRMVANYKVSVRLLDPNGDQRVATDTQPGYGLTPTSLWRPGERVADRYNLTLPDDLPPGEGYRLQLIFYFAASGTEAARVDLGPFALPLGAPVVLEPRPRLFAVPPLSHPLDVDFNDPAHKTGGDHIRLAGYDLEIKTESLELRLWWVAQHQPQINYTVFVHLFDPADKANVITQHDAMPRQGSYPTSGWLSGEVVSDTIGLPLQDLSPGTYQLAVGLYDVTTGDRLAATTSDGVPIPDDRLILPNEIKVSGE